MADEEFNRKLLDTLRDIRDAQREMVALLTAQRALAEEQLRRSCDSLSESIGLQRLALRRQRSITYIALPGIVACIAAILYLVLRYF